MPKKICFANLKGGVGKTTSATNIAAWLAMKHKNVLLIDNDPQANSTYTLLPRDTEILESVRSLYFKVPLENAVYPSVVTGLDIVPATLDMASIEIEISTKMRKEYLLKKALGSDFAKQYDYIIIDTQPSLSSAVVNALTAADEVIIPINGVFSLEGLDKLLEIVGSIQEEDVNPTLKIGAILLTMYDGRTCLNQDIKQKIIDVFGEDLLLKTTIPINVKLGEASSCNKSIFEHDPDCKGAQAYRQVTEELLTRWE